MVTIQAAAELTGLTVKAIRHYERIGLCPPASRSDTGYRLYSNEDFLRLREIKYYRDLQFPLQEIGPLLRAPRKEVEVALYRQKQVLEEKQETYRRALATLNAALSAGESASGTGGCASPMAVVTIDLQNDILEGGALPCKRIGRILPTLAVLFDQARALGIPVIYICDRHKKGDPELLLWNDHMMEGSWGEQIIDDVTPGPDDYIVHKKLFNGFLGTDLQSILDRLKVRTLLFTGWRTHVCVAQTAIEAFYRGFQVCLAEDGMDSTTAAEHEYGLSLMRVNYGFETYTCRSALESLLCRDK